MRIGTLVVAVLAAIVFFTAAPRERGPATERPANAERILISSPLSLSAVRTDSGVSLTWDAGAAPIRNARVGVLSIREGDTSREIPLSQSQLAAANLVYMPQSDRLEVALEVFSASGEPLRESMIVAVAPQARQPQAVSPSVPPLSAPQEHEASATRTRRFVPPLPRARPVPSDAVLLSDAPPVPPAEAASLSSAPFRSLNTQLPRPPQAPTQSPRAVRQVRPAVPSKVAALIRVPTHVRVRVKIDARGNVTQAEALNPSNSGINAFLTTAAVDAARSWTFSPARQGSVAVPSEIMLSFAFGADQ